MTYICEQHANMREHILPVTGTLSNLATKYIYTVCHLRRVCIEMWRYSFRPFSYAFFCMSAAYLGAFEEMGERVCGKCVRMELWRFVRMCDGMLLKKEYCICVRGFVCQPKSDRHLIDSNGRGGWTVYPCNRATTRAYATTHHALCGGSILSNA